MQPDFDERINHLMSAFIYWPIMIQCIIHFLFRAIKLQLEEDETE